MSKYSTAFFGTSHFSVGVLDELKKADQTPSLIVTVPDQPQGRHLKILPNIVKTWALENGVPILETEKLDDETFKKLSEKSWDLFIVASYGKIIPERFIDLPKHKTLNVHPSLLPLLRGPSPIQYTILEDMHEAGVTIMAIDKEMDHGPIVEQEVDSIEERPPYRERQTRLAHEGGKLLATILPAWIGGTISPQDQDHTQATFTKKIAKEDGLIDVTQDPYQNFLKIQAFSAWPGTYFFTERKGKKIRLKITRASFKDGALTIEKVIPEGKNEMSYADFQRGN